MEFQNYIYVQILFLIGVLLFLGREVFLIRKRSNPIEKKQLYLLQLILFIGVLVRIINLSYPNGVHVDEAMGAYDAWCLANFGFDSNLASYPVYLKSWGTGQSVLYAYLALPFVKFLGLSVEAYRLPMALIGGFTLLFFYWTLRKTQKNVLFIFCVSVFFAINPWHIIKGRFGMDCNIFPDLLLIGICIILIAYYLESTFQQLTLYVLGFAMIVLSAYGYAVSWLALPFLYSMLLWHLFKSQKINLKTVMGSIIVSFVIVLPLLLFVYVLVFDGDQFQIGQMTITKLGAGRHETTTLFATDNFFLTLLSNIKNAGRLCVFGVDNMAANALPIYGIFYNIISWPFLIYGLYKSRKKKNPLTIFFLIWLISSLPIIILVEPNINHWNILWFPVIYFTGYGVYLLAEKLKENQILFLSIYSIFFVVFLYTYFDKRIYNPFNSYTFKGEIEFCQSQNFDKVYYPNDIIHSFILFYAPIDPSEFATTRIDKDGTTFAKSYTNVVVGLPNSFEAKPKTAYVVPNDKLNFIDLSQFKIKKGKYYYSVIWND